MTTPVNDYPGEVSAPRKSSAPVPVAPSWPKLKGLAIGLVSEVPVITLFLWLTGVAGVTAQREFVPLMRLVAAFAGIAALLTAMGVARTAAFASMEGEGGRWRSIKWAAATHAVAGIGLAVIASVAAGLFTAAWSTWLAAATAGLLAGTVCGALIGVVCGGPSPISAADLVAFAKRPTDIFVHAVIDPASGLVRMGGRVADKAGHVASDLVDGLFDPAAPPPTSMTDIPTASSADTPDSANEHRLASIGAPNLEQTSERLERDPADK